MCRSSPYNSVVKKSPNGKNITAPFLTAGPCGYFEKNPYFDADIKPTYKITYGEKFKGTPFLPPSTAKHVSHVPVLVLQTIIVCLC